MLSNPDKKVAFAYQVISPDTPPERQFAKRWTFYIDPAGKIAFIDKAVNRRRPDRTSSRSSASSTFRRRNRRWGNWVIW